MFQYRFHEPVVARFHRSTARIRIPCAPARTSKSWSSAHDAFPEVFPDYERDGGKTFPVNVREKDDRRLWVVCPTYSINKEFDYLQRLLVAEAKQKGFDYKVESNVFSPKQGTMEVVVNFGRDKNGVPVRTRVEGKSATNRESLQSEEVDFAVFSEAAEHPEYVWTRYLSTRAKRAVFPTTPKVQADWLRAMIELGEADPSLGIESFGFTPRCNPLYDWERYWQEHAKAERRTGNKAYLRPQNPRAKCSRQNGHDCFDEQVDCGAMRDPWFAEQFGGRWTHEADRVLPFRWEGEDSNVLDAVPEWWATARKYITVDYGYTDPACVLWFAMASDGTCLVYREIYEPKLSPSDLFRRVHQENAKLGETIEWYVSDPQQPGVEAEMKKSGFPFTGVRMDKKAVRDRDAGYTRLIQMLSVDASIGRPKLFVLSEKCGPGFGCPRTIHEWRTLHRREGSSRSEFSTGAIVGNDHAADAMRYGLMSHPKTAPVSRQKLYYLEEHRRAVLQMQHEKQWRHDGGRSPMAGSA